jgi:hypothetical protein
MQLLQCRILVMNNCKRITNGNGKSHITWLYSPLYASCELGDIHTWLVKDADKVT